MSPTVSVQLQYFPLSTNCITKTIPTFNACHNFYIHEYIFLVFQNAAPQLLKSKYFSETLPYWCMNCLLWSYISVMGYSILLLKKKHGPHTPCLIILTKIMWEVSDVWACHKHTQSLCFSYRAFIFEACAKINLLWLAFYLLFHTVKSLLGHTVCQTGTFLNI